jgi:effector-binding domain-containing protein
VTPARASSRAGVTSPAFYREVYLEGCRATDDPNEYITEIQFSVEKSE